MNKADGKKEKIKFHDFKLNHDKSRQKGKLYKTAGGLWMMADNTMYTYECKRCDSAIEFPDKVNDLRSLNTQFAERYSCR